ncbi:MAG: hypothetical protein ACJ716_05740 [Marmoricola sp.]
MTSQTVGSDFTDGTRLSNWVNGRLLVAEDLATSQQSLRTRDQRVGEAAGAGIVRGMWVTGTQTTISVAPGLAMSRAGEAVVVPRTVKLPLTFTIADGERNDAAFGCCGSDGTGGPGSSLVSGILLLTARPSCRLEGQAPLAPPPNSKVSPCCAAQWQVEGVEFRAISLPIATSVDGVSITAGNRRNLVAHWCFGSEQLATLGQDPFGFDPAYDGFSQLDSADLTPYDVPLAVFSWDGSALSDLDNWAARRKVTQPDPTTSSWFVEVAPRRDIDGEARFLQFQDQAEELVSRSLAGSAVASQYFGLLPPVGFLPVDNVHLRKTAEDGYKGTVLENQNVTTAEDANAANEAVWAARLAAAREEADDSNQEEIQLADEPSTNVGKFDQLKLDYYRTLMDIADTSVGYGFDPETFFGPLARLGGIIDWDLADFALRQSWRAQPVPTRGAAVQLTTEEPTFELTFDTPRTYRSQPAPYSKLSDVMGRIWEREKESSDPAATAPRGDPAAPPPPPITYYYVIQNLEAAEAATMRRRRTSLKHRHRTDFVRSNLYVVFIANQRWDADSEPPFMSYRSGFRVRGDDVYRTTEPA